MSKAQYAICLATLCLILVLDGSYISLLQKTKLAKLIFSAKLLILTFDLQADTAVDVEKAKIIQQRVISGGNQNLPQLLPPLSFFLTIQMFCSRFSRGLDEI